VEVAGVNGCRAGWLVARSVGTRQPDGPDIWIAPTFEDVLASTNPYAAVAVDIPIGLEEDKDRPPDLEARSVLRPARASSIFPAPIRPVLTAKNYEEACAISFRVRGKKISRQSYALVKKIKQVDNLMTPALQRRVFEVHPEVSFWALNGHRPLPVSKKTPAGAEARLQLLSAVFESALLRSQVRSGFALDDVLDACAAAWTAWRFATGQAKSLPADPPTDVKGLRMEIVY